MDYSLPGSTVRGISQARILEWVAVSFSRGSFQIRDQTHVSCIGLWILYHWATVEALYVFIFNTLNYPKLTLVCGVYFSLYSKFLTPRVCGVENHTSVPTCKWLCFSFCPTSLFICCSANTTLLSGLCPVLFFHYGFVVYLHISQCDSCHVSFQKPMNPRLFQQCRLYAFSAAIWLQGLYREKHEIWSQASSKSQFPTECCSAAISWIPAGLGLSVSRAPNTAQTILIKNVDTGFLSLQIFPLE